MNLLHTKEFNPNQHILFPFAPHCISNPVFRICDLEMYWVLKNALGSNNELGSQNALGSINALWSKSVLRSENALFVQFQTSA